ncbi:hypothetical protein [Brevibacillus reuszeri]|uniref:hypothetical protein n=1 Tax=Brevibacillus reuszeri TaxID=54915 RepID=UPI00289C6B3F|nr:hypothetical protein [Brevibacillus reuszeri]
MAHSAAGGLTTADGIAGVSELSGYHAAFLVSGAICGISALASLLLRRHAN